MKVDSQYGEQMVVRDKIRNYAENARINGEERLPSERKLANMLGCSRMDISKAMSHLEAEGIVERRQGSGTYLVENKRENRTFNVAIALRNSYHSSEQHFLKLMRCLSKSAEQSNMHIQVFDNLSAQFDRNLDNNSLMNSVNSGIVNGVLTISRFSVKVLGQLFGKVPLAMVNNNFAGYMDIPSICCDYFQSGFLAAEHLIKNGHRRIGYICNGSLEHPEIRMHLSGMSCALRAYGVSPLCEDSILVLSPNIPDREMEMGNYMRTVRPTSVFTRNDIIAAEVIKVVEKMGLGVPGDLSVIGEGDYSWGGQPEVPLTTIDNKLSDACDMGLDLIRKMCNGETDFPQHINIAPVLVERKSVDEI